MYVHTGLTRNTTSKGKGTVETRPTPTHSLARNRELIFLRCKSLPFGGRAPKSVSRTHSRSVLECVAAGREGRLDAERFASSRGMDGWGGNACRTTWSSLESYVHADGAMRTGRAGMGRIVGERKVGSREGRRGREEDMASKCPPPLSRLACCVLFAPMYC